ncbi:hypothetical protein IGB42_01412 [Andreprevotia sp. IGB-42]|uniref:Ig-like domain-containing protein n=1 Tax=Andreprevotia sp. IGB-42 TaxID=2497473 RepID=UPI0013568B8D|nr:Ig-like domain-containing protein [Andreprevotia sp. IGB-42]KAF0813733.1 hypothetical protein IGB42_01412 [Andreprevotia sp. IGB-42]
MRGLTCAALISAVFSLAACNGGAGGGSLAGNPTPTPVVSVTPTPLPPVAANLVLLADSTQLPAIGTVKLTALTTSNKNVALSGQTVTFSASSGLISNVSSNGVSGADGQVTASLSAGVDGTPRTIRVTVTSGTAQATVDITVIGNQARSVKIGAGNKILVPSDTQYSDPHNVLVTDAAGNPVQNATVTLVITPMNFYQGRLAYDATAKFWIYSGAITLVKPSVCTLGGLGNPVSVSPPVVVTDASGFAKFDVNYAKSFAYWVDVELTATTTLIGGSVASDKSQFNLKASSDELADEKNTPANAISPFYPPVCP